MNEYLQRFKDAYLTNEAKPKCLICGTHNVAYYLIPKVNKSYRGQYICVHCTGKFNHKGDYVLKSIHDPTENDWRLIDE